MPKIYAIILAHFKKLCHSSFLFKPSAFYSHFLLPLADFSISLLWFASSFELWLITLFNTMFTELFFSDLCWTFYILYKAAFSVNINLHICHSPMSTSWILRCLVLPLLTVYSAYWCTHKCLLLLYTHAWHVHIYAALM